MITIQIWYLDAFLKRMVVRGGGGRAGDVVCNYMDVFWRYRPFLNWMYYFENYWWIIQKKILATNSARISEDRYSRRDKEY